MTKQRVLVLGANGFIGSHLVDRLVRDGYLVRAFARFNGTSAFEKSETIELFSGDFLNHDDIEQALKGVSLVVHLISTTNPATSDKDPLIDLNTNVEGSLALFQKCVENGNIKRVIFTSSGGTVYGDHYPGRPFLETDPTEPVSPYGIGKLTIENFLRYYYKSYNLDYTVLRITNPYGGRQKNTKHQGIIPVLVNNIAKEIPIKIYGDGSMIRDYIYIYDVIDIISRALERDLRHKTYNVSSGVGTSINKLIELLEEVIGKKALVEYDISPTTFVKTSVLDNTRLLEEMPDIDLTHIKDGLSNIYSNYQRSSS